MVSEDLQICLNYVGNNNIKPDQVNVASIHFKYDQIL